MHHDQTKTRRSHGRKPRPDPCPRARHLHLDSARFLSDARRALAGPKAPAGDVLDVSDWGPLELRRIVRCLVRDMPERTFGAARALFVAFGFSAGSVAALMESVRTFPAPGMTEEQEDEAEVSEATNQKPEIV